MGARVWGMTPHGGTKGRAHEGRAGVFPSPQTRPCVFRRGLLAARGRQGAFLGTLAQKWARGQSHKERLENSILRKEAGAGHS